MRHSVSIWIISRDTGFVGIFKFQSKRSIRVASFALGSLLLAVVFFQNCAPRPLEQGEYATIDDTGISGDSAYRLPANFNETLNTGVTCAVTVTSANTAIGGTYSYNFTTTGTIPPGYRIYAYGSKNGISDASEVAPEYLTTLSQAYSNPGYIGGTYLRYFQIRDTLGRALCQTNTVQTVLEGRSCTLSTSTTSLKVGQDVLLTIGYGAGSAVPAGATLEFQGSNNGQGIASIPYDGASNTQYVRRMTTADAGMEYVRRIVVRNTDSSIFCQTNNVRIRISL